MSGPSTKKRRHREHPNVRTSSDGGGEKQKLSSPRGEKKEGEAIQQKLLHLKKGSCKRNVRTHSYHQS